MKYCAHNVVKIAVRSTAQAAKIIRQPEKGRSVRWDTFAYLGYEFDTPKIRTQQSWQAGIHFNAFHLKEPATKRTRNKPAPLHFPSVPVAEASQRAGKHQKIISEILSDLAKVDEYSAIKINLEEVGKKKADLRAALHREAKKQRVNVATSSDEKHLYVFHAARKM